MDSQALRDNVEGVLSSECGLDKVHAHVDRRIDLEAPLRRLAGELGWFAICVGEEAGGVGLGDEAFCLVSRELGRALAPGGLALSLMAAPILAEHAPEALRSRYLERALTGDLGVAIEASLMETPSASGPRQVLGGPDSEILLIASDAATGGPELLLIEVGEQADALREVVGWDLTRRICLATLEGLPGHRLGAAAYHHAVRRMALHLACDSLGLSETILARTVEYLETREQFGRKLATLQALKHRVADLYIAQQLHRSLIDVAACEVSTESEAASWSMLCKAEVTDGAAKAAGECLQLHGAIGFTWEHDCHLFLKRSRLNQSLLADNDGLRVESSALLPAVLAAWTGTERVAHAAC